METVTPYGSDFQAFYMAQLSPNQQIMFVTDYNANKKNTATGVWLALLLGGVGAQHFYLGNVGWGVFCIVFCWSFLPAILGLFDAFFVPGRVYSYNERLALGITQRLKAIESPPPHETSSNVVSHLTGI